jgi:drug/metabolite transporter (DMT)-like permease
MQGISGNLRGMLWMTLSGAVFAANYGIIRILSLDFHVFELVFFRNLFGLLVLTPFLWRSRHEIKKPKRPSIIVLRGFLQAGSSSLWFYGVTVIPLVTATSLMLIEPIIGSVLAILLLKEPNDPKRWLSVFLGMIGALVIIRPGMVEFSLGVSFILTAAIMWSGFLLLGKVQSRDDSIVVVIAYSSALTVLLSLVPALFFWVTPTIEQLFLLVILGTVATAAYFCITNAYKAGDVTVVSPLNFMRTIFSAIVGFFVFNEMPEAWVWFGAAIIVAAATYLARVEFQSTSRKET